MNNRINETLHTLKATGKKALVPYITGGDPDIETTEKLVLAMAEAGADMIEIGIPFSDPIAESAVMQAADERALGAGCTVDKLFDMVARLREKTNIPLLFMTYANPIYAYGKDRFMARCQSVGIDGIVVPDVPFEERAEFESECDRYGVYLIASISPSSAERTAAIAKGAKGFLYCVPALCNESTDMRGDISRMIADIKQVADTPCLIGFGVSTPAQARDMAAVSDGVVVSSRFVELVGEYGRGSVEPAKALVCELKNLPLT